MRLLQEGNRERRRGTALVTVVIFAALLTVFVAAGLTITTSSVDEVEHEHHIEQAFFAAEAGVNAALSQVALAYRTGQSLPCNQGTKEAPSHVYAGDFWSRVINNDDDTLTIVATGLSSGEARTVEVVVRPTPAGPLDHAMFAGNFSQDPAYQLKLNGTGSQADYVVGDIYSGGDVMVDEDAEVDGSLRAAGGIAGGDGLEGVAVDVPRLLEIDYERFHDYDVADLFDDSRPKSSDAGGTANQLPEDSVAHFFRLNPSDRTSNTSATEKDDYFLEDPYETPTADYAQDGSDAYPLTIPEKANNSVFFVDGNLWLHNKRTYSFKVRNEGTAPTRVTFVVKGNVYFSDNFFYDDPSMDGVAFIALSDPDVEDSGNVYFGDPSFGTMQYAESMIFAENNFYDNNLSDDKTSEVVLRGAMTAANKIAIERDFGDKHTRLALTYDDRQKNGALNLPGVPSAVDEPLRYSVVSWREVSTPKTMDLRELDPSYEAPDYAQGVVGDPGRGGLGATGLGEADITTVDSADQYEALYDTFSVESPTGLGIEDPFVGDGLDWRTRWSETFGNDWLTTQRDHRWSGNWCTSVDDAP